MLNFGGDGTGSVQIRQIEAVPRQAAQVPPSCACWWGGTRSLSRVGPACAFASPWQPSARGPTLGRWRKLPPCASVDFLATHPPWVADDGVLISPAVKFSCLGVREYAWSAWVKSLVCRTLQDLEEEVFGRKAELDAQEGKPAAIPPELPDDLVNTNAYLMWLDNGRPMGADFGEVSRGLLMEKLKSGR